MMVQTSEALELCSDSEWELIEHSFPPMVAMLPRSALKSRLGRARKLYAKTTDLVSLQYSEPRKRTTRRKVEMFAEAIDRFEATLDLLENAHSVEPPPKDELLSALAVHGIQQKRRAGARGVQSRIEE